MIRPPIHSQQPQLPATSGHCASGLHATCPRSTGSIRTRSRSSCPLTYNSRELKHTRAHTHAPQPAGGPGALRVRMQSAKRAFASPPDSSFIPIITKELYGGMPSSLQGKLLHLRSSVWTVAVLPRGRATRGKVQTHAHGTGLLRGRQERALREGGQLK